MFLSSPHRLLSVTESSVVLPPNVRELIANITTREAEVTPTRDRLSGFNVN